jgi:hypothetical protein
MAPKPAQDTYMSRVGYLDNIGDKHRGDDML